MPVGRGRRVGVAAVVVWCALAGAGCRAAAPSAPAVSVRDQHMTMGSLLVVTAWTADEPRARAAFQAVFAEFDRLDALLSVWKPGSDVLRINDAPAGTPVAVRAETREVLRAAEQVSTWTDGGFDVTFGALAEVWKFDHDKDDRVPTDDEIAARIRRVDHRAIAIDDGPGTVRLTRPGVRVHLGGIGKGYAVDRAVAILRSAELRDFMVQAGGDLYVAGRAGETPWRLGIQDPRGATDDPFATVELADATFSTSGDYERYFEQGGVRYHHILDPKTGRPARGCRSVTIVAREALWADGLSTGVFILGPERGMALVERVPDVEAVIVTADNRVLVSSGLTGRTEIRRQPTP